MSSQSKNHRATIYFSEDALEIEEKIAKMLDENGYAGIYKSNGDPNRSAIVSACYLIIAGEHGKVPKR